MSLHRMAKVSFSLGLITGLLALLSCTVAVDITDIFTVQPGGTNNGGCDDRPAVLDQWLSEAIESLDVALVAIDEYDQDPRVRRSMAAIFGITNSGRLRGARAMAVETVRSKCWPLHNFHCLLLDTAANLSSAHRCSQPERADPTDSVTRLYRTCWKLFQPKTRERCIFI